jgi:uncharacterized protein (DUF4415 family)
VTNAVQPNKAWGVPAPARATVTVLASRAREIVLRATPRAAKGRASTADLAETLVCAQTTDVRSACASAATVDALEGNAAGYQTRVNRALRYVLEAEPALSGA